MQEEAVASVVSWLSQGKLFTGPKEFYEIRLRNSISVELTSARGVSHTEFFYALRGKEGNYAIDEEIVTRLFFRFKRKVFTLLQ